MYFIVKLISFLPTILGKLVSTDQAEKISMVFTNVPGPKTPLVFQGKKVNRIVFFAPGFGALGNSLSIMTHCDNLKIGVASDVSQIAEPKKLIGIIEENIDRILKEYNTP